MLAEIIILAAAVLLAALGVRMQLHRLSENPPNARLLADLIARYVCEK
jgi:hypothetical protein